MYKNKGKKKNWPWSYRKFEFQKVIYSTVSCMSENNLFNFYIYFLFSFGDKISFFKINDNSRWHFSYPFLKNLGTPCFQNFNSFNWGWCCACMCVYSPHTHLIPVEDKRGHKVSQNWSQTLVNFHVGTGNRPGSSGGATYCS